MLGQSLLCFSFIKAQGDYTLVDMSAKQPAFRSELEAISKEVAELEEKMQVLAVLALSFAQKGNLVGANLLIRESASLSGFSVYGPLIEWFERYGKLAWNNKKNRLVNSNH